MAKYIPNEEVQDQALADIDPDNLDRELLGQSKRYLKYADKLADAKYDLDKCEDRLEVAKAEAELDIRQRPRKYKIEDIKEQLVKAHVRLHPAVVKANRMLIQKKYRVKILEGAVKSLEHRKRMLEKYTDALESGLFSRPRPKGLGTTNVSMDRRKKAVRVRRAENDAEDDDD